MLTTHLFVLIHVRNMDAVGIFKYVEAISKHILLNNSKAARHCWIFFWYWCLVFIWPFVSSVSFCLEVTSWIILDSTVCCVFLCFCYFS